MRHFNIKLAVLTAAVCCALAVLLLRLGYRQLPLWPRQVSKPFRHPHHLGATYANLSRVVPICYRLLSSSHEADSDKDDAFAGHELRSLQEDGNLCTSPFAISYLPIAS